MSLEEVSAADLLSLGKPPVRRYWDRVIYNTFEDQLAALKETTTIYVGNLSYYTSEQHIYELARQAGPIKRVIMGLHKVEKTPCGFAFVEYFSRKSCLDAEAMLTGKVLENRVVKFELDPGFVEGRQFGRGQGGGQVRDDLRDEFDGDRGGYGALATIQQSSSVNTSNPDSGYPTKTTSNDIESKYQDRQFDDSRRDQRFETDRRGRNRSPRDNRKHHNKRTKVDEFGRDVLSERSFSEEQDD